jgi:hypothetical protein
MFFVEIKNYKEKKRRIVRGKSLGCVSLDLKIQNNIVLLFEMNQKSRGWGGGE